MMAAERERTGESPSAHLVEAGAGAAVLCLHGWGASAELFAPLIRDLGEQFRLIAPDFPGFGGTAEPPTAWSVDDYVDWTLQLLDRLGLAQVDIVAHSFGARVALKLAVREPQRVGRLVLTGAAGLRARRGLGYHVRVRTFKLARRVTTSRLPLPLIGAWAGRRVAAAGSRDYRAASGAMRGTFVRVVNEDLRSLLPRVKASTLLVWGDGDDETPLDDGRAMERAIPDAGLVVFEGRGHYAYIDEAARFARVVATFLGADTPG